MFTIHNLGTIFIVRGKKNVKFKRILWKRRLQSNVLSDSIIRFAGYYQEKDYPEELRLIKYWDDENKREFIFLINNFDLTALEIAELYRQRWQIELFFKWMKSHLKIKHFYGTSFNAVKTQIYVAIITFCLVSISCKDNEMMVRLVDDYNAFAVLNEIRTIVEEGMRFEIEQKERIMCRLLLI